MVSRYRDIIENNQGSLSRATSFMSTAASLRNGEDDFRIEIEINDLSLYVHQEIMLIRVV